MNAPKQEKKVISSINELIGRHNLENIKKVEARGNYVWITVKEKIGGFLIHVVITAGYSINTIRSNSNDEFVVTFSKQTI